MKPFLLRAITGAILLGSVASCSKKKDDATPAPRHLVIRALTIKALPTGLSSQSPYLGVDIEFSSADGMLYKHLGPNSFAQTTALPARRTVYFEVDVIDNVDPPIEITVYKSDKDPNFGGGIPVKVGTVHMNTANRDANASQDFSEGGTVIGVESTFK
jgi:hypothetical protein